MSDILQDWQLFSENVKIISADFEIVVEKYLLHGASKDVSTYSNNIAFQNETGRSG